MEWIGIVQFCDCQNVAVKLLDNLTVELSRFHRFSVLRIKHWKLDFPQLFKRSWSMRLDDKLCRGRRFSSLQSSCNLEKDDTDNVRKLLVRTKAEDEERKLDLQ
jgi:hypothetical protein